MVMKTKAVKEDAAGSSDDSEDDVITDYLTASPARPSMARQENSAAAGILDDSIKYIQEIQSGVQRMREMKHLRHLQHNLTFRLSSSCPCLGPEGNNKLRDPVELWVEQLSAKLAQAQYDMGGKEGTPSIRVTGSTPSGSVEHLSLRPDDILRRQSWSGGAEDGHWSPRSHRSVSLGSLEPEEARSLASRVVPDVPDGGCLTTTSSTKASCHSLNDVDSESERGGPGTPSRPLRPRLTLQKSISTPSIFPPCVDAEEVVGVAHATAMRPSGTESETEEEGMMASLQLAHALPTEFLREPSSQEEEEGGPKRRKKGSRIFFRGSKKRKEKDKPKKGSGSHSHVFACVSYNNYMHVCDVCQRPFDNKTALRCDNCLANVHDSCKDQIMDCSKFKLPKRQSQILGGNTKSFSIGSRISSSGPLGLPPTGTRSGSVGSISTTMHLLGGSSKEDDKQDPPEEIASNQRFMPFLSASEVDSGPELGDDSTADLADVDSDPEVKLLEEEPEAWSKSVEKQVLMEMSDLEIKRQEHIYEFIMTEKHHCITLQVMKKLFMKGLRDLDYRQDILDRIFPKLTELIDLHREFLRRLRIRQAEKQVVDSLTDILVEQFSGERGEKMKDCYGVFCSRHKEAVSHYKDMHKNDRNLQIQARRWSNHPLCKKKGIPECILFVTQRITKYPLLIEPLIKTTKHNPAEQEQLRQASKLVRGILIDVNAQVAEKEREQRLLEIYNKIDAKSSTMFQGHKFKKSDLLSGNRKLRFEGIAALTHREARLRHNGVLVVVLGDVVFFLNENSHKYYFLNHENKATVLSLSKLLVREKAGVGSQSIYLISSNEASPDMYELVCQSPRDRKSWVESIKEAIQQSPEEEQLIGGKEESRKLMEARSVRLRQLCNSLRDYDVDIARLCEEKTNVFVEMLETLGHEDTPLPPGSVRYTDLITENSPPDQIAARIINALQEVGRLAHSLYIGGGSNLARSASSVGEHHSEAYVSPVLPRRAETFGGFDGAPPNKGVLSKKLSGSKLVVGNGTANDKPVSPVNSAKQTKEGAAESCVDGQTEDSSGVSNVAHLLIDPPLLPLLTGSCEQQWDTPRLQHSLSQLLCILQQQYSAVASLQAQLTEARDKLGHILSEGKDKRSIYKHNQQLEELRNLQGKLNQERADWQKQKDSQEEELKDKKEELSRLQEQLKGEQNDISQQRELLYRKLDALKAQGIVLSSNMALVADGVSSSGSSPTGPPESLTHVSPPSTIVKNRRTVSGAPQHLPITLVSTTNEQKGKTVGKSVKQQIPLKLAKLSSGPTEKSPSSAPTPLAHTSPPPHIPVAASASGGVQQLLPMKLSEDPKVTPKASFGYQKFGTIGSPGSSKGAEAAAVSHSRSGSSPANVESSVSIGHNYKTYPGGKNTVSPPKKVRDPETNQEIFYF